MVKPFPNNHALSIFLPSLQSSFQIQCVERSMCSTSLSGCRTGTRCVISTLRTKIPMQAHNQCTRSIVGPIATIFALSLSIWLIWTRGWSHGQYTAVIPLCQNIQGKINQISNSKRAISLTADLDQIFSIAYSVYVCNTRHWKRQFCYVSLLANILIT